MAGHLWKIEMLGPLCAKREEQVITRFRTKQTGALLACLASQENRLYRREELVDLLWPEHELESGRNCLRIALSYLRQNLESPDDSIPVLLADRQHVQLNPAAYTTDKAEFEAALKRATRAETDEERATLLTEAADLYKSDLLPGYDEEWIIGERQRLADAHLMGLRRLIKLQVKAQNVDAALDYARRALNVDPLREESHRVLMQLYTAIGRKGAALRQYQELERILQEELGTSPSPAARELAAQVAGGAVKTSAAPQRSSVAVVNTAFPSPSPSFPPLRFPGLALGTRSGHLPSPLTRFFGREDDISQVIEMIDTPETRLITLTGLGGSGKTRLALALAEQVYEEFNGAVWFAPLAPLTEPRQIIDAIYQSLQVPRSGNTPPLEQVITTLSYRPSLLILDNFEHLADRGALIVQTLLDRVPTLRILVTSRQRLNLSGEYEYGVKPLATPLTAGHPERLMEFASVQLFVDRAQTVKSGFQVTPANAASVAALCHHLEGVPLAIELAAAYAQMMTPAQILTRLSSRFTLLVNRSRDAAPRHASLRAALDWSYNLLEPELQRFFARLSVFRGGWTIEAAEAVCREPMALEYLMQLRERSLVSVEETETEMRLSLLETVREYAEEQLAAEEKAEAHRQHIAFFLQFAEQAEAPLCGPEAPYRLEQLAQEHDNLCAAMDRAGHAPEQTLQMAAAVWRFWYVRGYQEEGLRRLEQALDHCPDAPPTLRAKALRAAGNLAYSQADYRRARSLFEQQMILAQKMNDARGVACALGSLGNVASGQGDTALARTMLKRSLSVFRGLDDQRGVSLTLANLGNVACDEEDYVAARALYQESLSLFRETGDQQNMLLSLNNLSHAVLRLGDFGCARKLLRESLALARCLESKRSLAHSLAGCTTLAMLQNSMQQAARLLGVADALRENIHAPLPAKAAREREREQERILGALGERAFTAAWEQGRAMNLEQATEYALEELEAPLRQ